MMTSESPNPGAKYRLGRQADLRRQEGINAAGPTLDDLSSGGRGRASGGVLQWVLAGVAVIAFVLMVFLSVGHASWQATGTLALVALVPLAAVTLVLGWIDRWAPLSWRLKLLALLLGAGVGAGGAVVINTYLSRDFLLYTGDAEKADFWSAVFVAPFSEEIFKGLAVVLVLLLGRHHLSTSLSGAAMGGLVGAGFAYVENILYFVYAHDQGTAVLGFTIFARGVMSPFIHPMATSFTGLAVAAALLKGAKLWGWLWRLLLGLLAAIGVHMLWNYLASASGTGWILWYLVVELPLLIAWLAVLLTWSSRQANVVRRGLDSYVQTGWVTPAEVAMATNRYAYRHARKWGKRIGPPAPRLVRKFVSSLRRLGLDQEVMTRLGPSPMRMQNDSVYLADVGAIREEFVHLEIVREGVK